MTSQSSGETFPISTEGIQDFYFQENFKDQQGSWMEVTNPRFINWMKASTKASFRKLWGKVGPGLPSGLYTLRIQMGMVKRKGDERA